MTTAALKSSIGVTVEDVIALIRDLARAGEMPRDLETARLSAETSLESLALDSLGKMALLSALDEHHGIYIPEDGVTDSTTIGSLVARVSGAARA